MIRGRKNAEARSDEANLVDRVDKGGLWNETEKRESRGASKKRWNIR
jgi:hypothetical protein